MGELLRLIFEYQTLVTRRDRLHERLSVEENVRVRALDRLLATPDGAAVDGVGADKRRHPRIELSLPARLYQGIVAHDVTLSELGGGGVGLASGAPPLRPGEVVILHYRDGDSDFECRMLCRVMWGDRAGHISAVGLSFTGMPLLLRAARATDTLAAVG